MSVQGKERRSAERKSVDSIGIVDLTSLSSYTLISKSGTIIDASTSGFLLTISRKELVPENLKQGLNLENIVGQGVVMYLPQMNLDLDGVVRRASHVGKGIFEIAIEFSNDIPKYWRECLVDLMPSPGEVPFKLPG